MSKKKPQRYSGGTSNPPPPTPPGPAAKSDRAAWIAAIAALLTATVTAVVGHSFSQELAKVTSGLSRVENKNVTTSAAQVQSFNTAYGRVIDHYNAVCAKHLEAISEETAQEDEASQVPHKVDPAHAAALAKLERESAPATRKGWAQPLTSLESIWLPKDVSHGIQYLESLAIMYESEIPTYIRCVNALAPTETRRQGCEKGLDRAKKAFEDETIKLVEPIFINFLKTVTEYDFDAGPERYDYFHDIIPQTYIPAGGTMRFIPGSGQAPTVTVPDAGARDGR